MNFFEAELLRSADTPHEEDDHFGQEKPPARPWN